MTSSAPSSTNEKVLDVESKLQKSDDLFSRFTRKSKGESKDESSDPSVTIGVDPKATQAEVSPVSFTQLFRFSTKLEIFLNVVGIVAAAAAGAAMTLMVLIFGNLTQRFVNFTTTSNNAAATGGSDAQAALTAASSDFSDAAAQNASYLVYFGVGIFVLTYIYMITWVYTSEINAKRIRERYLQAVLRQDIQFFDNVGAGEIATRIQTDTHLVQQGMSEKVALVVYFSSSFITAFVLAYVRSWRLALALTSILPFISIAGVVMNHFVSKYTQLSLKHVADGGSIAEEVISTIRTAKAFGSQNTLARLYDRHVGMSYSIDTKSAIWHSGGIAVFFFVVYAAYSLAFSFGTTLIGEGHATPGDVITVVMAIILGSFSLAMLAPEMQVTNALGAAAKLYQTIDQIPEIDSSDPSGEKPDQVEGKITFENVIFNYPSRPTVPVLKSLSLTFNAGKTCAIVGASGSGKSTVVSLVERFYDPNSGIIKLDGRDIKTLNIKWLRSQIGLVSQEPTLFGTTVRENVAHGLIGTQYEDVSEEEKFALVKEACIKANADGFISKLPNGYDTMVGERGFLLSGGQKQRVAIARAIVSDPRILLLDEATSALDTQSEGIVQDALDKASAGRTTITIAHRLSTIKDADVIYVMGDGNVLESGTHDELLTSENGAYARLVQAQRLREGEAQEPTSPVETEKDLSEEVPLGRRTTGKSFNSEIGEHKQTSEEGGVDHSLPYIFKRMGVINRDQWRNYLFGSVAAIIAGLAAPAYGIVFGQGINGFSEQGHDRRVAGDRNALWFFLIAIASTIGICFQNYLFALSAAALTAKLRSLSFQAILRQDIQYFDKKENSTGTLTSNLSQNPQKINGLAGVTLGAIVGCTATFVASIIVGLVFAWKIALVALATSPLLLSAGYIRLRIVVMKDQTNKRAHEDSAQLACEAAGAIRTVASLTREDNCCRVYATSLEEPLRKSNITAVWGAALYAMSQAMIFFITALVFWFGARLVSEGELSTFQFFVGLMSAVFGINQAGNVFQFVPDVSSAQGAASDTIKLLDSVPEIDVDSPDGKKIDAVQTSGQIRFEDVHFQYPTRPGVRVLRGLTLQAEPGTYNALVGASGCGKSTIIQLIERFYDPLAGQIYLDGERISELNIQEYRQSMALVSQEPTLYAGTVRFNILLGAVKPENEVTQAEIEEACRNANILDFIKSLPDGFETEVGGKGSQLSGGQKQRIAIARALLRNPKVLLLDEATSALDSNSEKVVQEALDQAAKGRTTIAVAHRLSTIQNADRIYFIKDGRVSEFGTHDQLLAKRRDYYEFVQLQALSRR